MLEDGNEVGTRLPEPEEVAGRPAERLLGPPLSFEWVDGGNAA